MEPPDDSPKQREALLSAMLDAVPDFVAQVDASGRVLYANQRTSPSGLPVELGASWLDLVAPAERDRAAVALVSVIARRAPLGIETRCEAADGGVTIYSTRMAPVIVDDLVTGVVAVTRDVTADKHAEAQLMRADRTSSVGALAAGVAHEINNPLSVVLANLQLLLRRAEPEGTAADELRDAVACAEQVKDIVRDLEVFSRSEAETLGPVDVNRVVESTLRMAWSEVRHRAQIVRELGDVPPVCANPARLGQLLLNLILNAAEAIPEGDYEGNTIRIATSVGADGRVVIAIRDTGAGIAPALHRRIFAPFVSTKGHGAGLGLTICRRIVTSLGGELTFTSEDGAGAEFTVRLPAATPPAPEPVVAGAPAAPVCGYVLVIDDDPLVVRTIKRVLAAHHDVVTVASAEAGLELIDGGERFDVILCDLMMPQMTGMDFMAALERRVPEQAGRVVFVTGGAFTTEARAFLSSDRYRRIDKPFSPMTLRGTVDDVMRTLR